MPVITNTEYLKKEGRVRFEEAFHAYSRELYVFAYRILRDKSIAEDVVQDFFVKLWLKRHEIQIWESFRAYCYTSVYNASLNVVRLKGRHIGVSEEMIGTFDVEQEIERAELRRKLDAAIESLPPRCREIFLDVSEGGISYAEVADKYQLSVNTIKVQMSKAYRLLREKLSDEQLLLLVLLYKRAN